MQEEQYKSAATTARHLRKSGEWRWVAVAMAVGFGALIVQQHWPTLQSYFQKWSAASEQSQSAQVPASPEQKAPSAPLPQAARSAEYALKGTQSSIAAHAQHLILTATIPGRNPAEGQASIGTDATNPQTYNAGAMLVNGAIVREIHAGHVVLERDGRRVVLSLRDDPGKLSSAPASEMLLVGGNASTPPPVAAPTSEVITEFIRPAPVYAGDSMTGVEVQPGSRSSAFHRWGLRSGDIITRIDGVALTGTEQAAELLRIIATGHAVTATVRRRQEVLTISLDGALIQEELDRESTRKAAGPEMLAGAAP